MSLILKDLSLHLPSRPLIQNFSLEIASGEIVTLMGPSGSGKSSLLSAIAGDLSAAFSFTGEVILNGCSITKLRPEQRRIGRLFQDDLLFPHMTIGENLLFGMPRGYRQRRLEKMRQALERVGLGGFESRNPATLSGGERQRASLMRMMLSEPKAVLLDEPFSKLDRSLRQEIRTLVFNALRDQNIPTLLVTHDPEDAPQDGHIIHV